MTDIGTKMQASLSAAGENWQTIQITACSTMDIVIQITEIRDQALPRSSNWCPTVTLEQCIQTEQPLSLDKDMKVWFTATDSACRANPLIFKTSVEQDQIEIDFARGQAVIHLLPIDTCCLSSRMHELFFTLALSGAPDNILARAQGALIVEPNAMGNMLLQQTKRKSHG